MDSYNGYNNYSYPQQANLKRSYTLPSHPGNTPLLNNPHLRHLQNPPVEDVTPWPRINNGFPQQQPPNPSPPLVQTPFPRTYKISSGNKSNSQSQQERARKDTHSQIEKRRREKMNIKFEELRSLFPTAVEGMSKLEILEGAIDYIRMLQGTSNASPELGAPVGYPQFQQPRQPMPVQNTPPMFHAPDRSVESDRGGYSNPHSPVVYHSPNPHPSSQVIHGNPSVPPPASPISQWKTDQYPHKVVATAPMEKNLVPSMMNEKNYVPSQISYPSYPNSPVFNQTSNIEINSEFKAMSMLPQKEQPKLPSYWDLVVSAPKDSNSDERMMYVDENNNLDPNIQLLKEKSLG